MRLFSYILLFSFLALITPKEVIHDCNSHDHDHDQNDSREWSNSQDNEITADCHFCDLTLIATQPTTPLFYKSYSSFFPSFNEETQQKSGFSHFRSYSRRGPPQC
jgi:hypothetical protein